MNVPQIGGVAAQPVAMKMVQPTAAQGSAAVAAGSSPNSTAQTAALLSTSGATGPVATTPSASISTRQSASSISTTAMLFDSAARTSNLALAYMILQMLLQGDEDKKSQLDPLLAGLAAGLLAAQPSRSPTVFYSSSMMSMSTEMTTSPQMVNQAYNTQMPTVAANPASSTAQAAGTPVVKVDMHA